MMSELFLKNSEINDVQAELSTNCRGAYVISGTRNRGCGSTKTFHGSYAGPFAVKYRQTVARANIGGQFADAFWKMHASRGTAPCFSPMYAQLYFTVNVSVGHRAHWSGSSCSISAGAVTKPAGRVEWGCVVTPQRGRAVANHRHPGRRTVKRTHRQSNQPNVR